MLSFPFVFGTKRILFEGARERPTRIAMAHAYAMKKEPWFLSRRRDLSGSAADFFGCDRRPPEVVAYHSITPARAQGDCKVSLQYPDNERDSVGHEESYGQHIYIAFGDGTTFVPALLGNASQISSWDCTSGVKNCLHLSVSLTLFL